MPVSRPDKHVTFFCERVGGQWTNFMIGWQEEIDDGAGEIWERTRSETYEIADLTTGARASLTNVLNVLTLHRDTKNPI